jgi:hypothetical protein
LTGIRLDGVVRVLLQVQQVDQALSLAQQRSGVGGRASALATVVGALAQAQQFEQAAVLAQQIQDDELRAEALRTLAQDMSQAAQRAAVIHVIRQSATIASPFTISSFVSSLPHLPTVLTLVQQLWSHTTTLCNLSTLLSAAAPLFVADPTLLPQILEGEQWVQEQLMETPPS